MSVEAPLELGNDIIQEQPDSGGVRQSTSFLKGTVLIARSGELPATCPTMVAEATSPSLTLSRSRNKGLRYRFRGARRWKRLGWCRCVVHGGINHQCKKDIIDYK